MKNTLQVFKKILFALCIFVASLFWDQSHFGIIATGCCHQKIDLGTTYNCVAVWQQDRVEVIVNDQGNRITPSFVAFTPSQRFVGDAAKYQIATNP
jgi:hypothetical protein